MIGEELEDEGSFQEELDLVAAEVGAVTPEDFEQELGLTNLRIGEGGSEGAAISEGPATDLESWPCSHGGVSISAATVEIGNEMVAALRKCYVPVAGLTVGASVKASHARCAMREMDLSCALCLGDDQCRPPSTYRGQLEAEERKAATKAAGTGPRSAPAVAPAVHEFCLVVGLGGAKVEKNVGKLLGMERVIVDETVSGALTKILAFLMSRSAVKSTKGPQWVGWVPLSGGHLGVWHRPGRSHVAALREEGCTMVVTIQAPSEQAADVGKLVEKAGMKWLNIPLQGANQALLGTPVAHQQVMVGARAAHAELLAGGRVLVHCAAGVHRTGVVSYTLLRLSGLDGTPATIALWRARRETGRGVAAHRIAVAEVIVQKLLKTMC